MTTDASLADSRIAQIAIPAQDLPRAVRFYRDALGLRFLFEVPGMAFFDCGGVRLLVGLATTDEIARASSVLYFRVEDIQATHAALAARGVTFLRAPHFVAKMPDHELWIGEFRDSENNVLAVMAEVRPAR
jgi:methylmalonyl-CoA/ethylmalonyl-CoA epimerase